MGQEIAQGHFHKHDFSVFESRLAAETHYLAECFQKNVFDISHDRAGFELESWLIDDHCRPVPENEAFLKRIDTNLVSPELSRYNIELNSLPRTLTGNVFNKMLRELEHNWARCNEIAGELDAEMLIIGILPTLQSGQLGLDTMSDMFRYRALNEQVLRLRKGEPVVLDIEGVERLHTFREDVMLESAATSFQLHLQVGQNQAARVYNAAIILSAPIVAATANSPFLFGTNLWDETRIPLFEQAVSVSSENNFNEPRVTFGTGYVKESLMECFTENIKRYPVLLPEILNEDPAYFSHLCLHNSTIWRWNRPLVGIDEKGRPHLRIENRVIPAGPSLVDTIANAALFYGLTYMLSTDEVAPESCLPFEQAKNNFYTAARYGLGARVHWLNGKEINIRNLLLTQLIPLARVGLEKLKIDTSDIELLLGIIEERVGLSRNGAAWQQAFVRRNGRDMQALTSAYREHQRTGKPVHEWGL
ncbi:MAG: glutamate--cysteine ligase [Acidiferrobacterales bacterium]